MKTKYHKIKYALFVGAFFLMSNFLAQSDLLKLLPGSRKANYNENNDLLKLEGNVHFEYQGNTMYCDSAYYFEKRRLVYAYGKVHIIRDKINMFCDSAFFNGKAERAKLWGNVRVRDLDYRLTTDSLEYISSSGRAIYRNYGTIKKIGSNEMIVSKVGYFYPESKNYFFSDSVVYSNDGIRMTTDTLAYEYVNKQTVFNGETTILKDSMTMTCLYGWYNTDLNKGYLHGDASYKDNSQILYADTIRYDEKNDEIIAKKDVHLINEKSNYVLNSNYMYTSDSIGLTYITDCAIAKLIQNKDTIYIHSDTLFVLNDTIKKNKNIMAYYGVKIYNNDIQSICDSLWFSQTQNKIKLYHNPIVWSENSELKGDSIVISTKDSLIDKINIYRNASAIMELDSGQLYNQISGKNMIAYMKEGKLRKTDVNGSAVSIYYPEDEEKTDSLTTIKRMGLNRLESSTLSVYLDSGEVIGINYVNEPVGIFYPMDQIIDKKKFIKNFEWNPALRPKDEFSLPED
ncbi:hypothetical protein N8017_02805 [Crocinitomicaceae bacterium]|nr:hypothetical protein [Crocinitomicaceae bacterium]